MHNIYPWQQEQWQYLLTRKNNGSLPHSLLLTGQHGLGQTDFALAFAELLLCRRPKTMACGSCRACKLIQAGNHPDLSLVRPETNSKIIKIDQIRNIIDTVTKQSHQGSCQVVIIEPADAMNIAAGNALLKTLEEPPGDVVIILLSDRASLLPATIRSRCQRIVFNAPLSELALLQENTKQQCEDLFSNFADLITGKMEALQFAESCLAIDLNTALDYLKFLLIDMVRIKTGVEQKFLFHADKAAILKDLCRPIDVAKLFNCFDKITNFINHYSNNLNKQLLLEDLSLYL